MAKPTTGHAQPVPQPDPEQMAADTLMTSVFTGISFVVAVVVFGAAGGLALQLTADSGRTTAMIAFGAALAGAMVLIGYWLRQFADRMRARSRNLYRGAWIGSVAALVIMVVMYYLPWIAFPAYCPPGAPCM